MRGAKKSAFYERPAKIMDDSITAPKGSKNGPKQGGQE
jgi:hypothetical protein